ncbi:hypothetical protein BJV78DRAFT_761181 [Lactifluus subvellereus]|nr:hypothetical protein BJV78DRAFT_761181 [Lactifluus subvellereus]
MADVFIAFDEAHPLTDHWDQLETSGLSNYTELRRALQVLSTFSLFTFFLPTDKISQFSPPRTHGPSNRICRSTFRPPPPFIELGFDQLMRNRKVLDKYKTLEQVTSSECIAHMGSPLWGTMHDLGDEQVRHGLLGFAIEKLLNSSTTSALKLTEDQQYAVLSQRLGLDIGTTAYVSAPLIDVSKKILKQIENHMCVCIEISNGMEIIRGIAASEPILSEAASYIMRQNFPNFDLAGSLSNVLSEFPIHLGDRRELLVAAFFTWARDNVIVKQPPPPLPEFCRHSSVREIISCLFFEPVVQSMFNDIPSIGPSKAEKRTLGEVTHAAHMHFNHLIQSQEKKIVAHRYLIAVMARGAAVLGANCQAGVDMVFPYLYGSTDLDDKNVGFIMVQVKNDSKFSIPDADLFQKMDPFQCGLLDKSDRNVRPFSIPIIRIVFALRGNQAMVTHMRYSSPSEGAFPTGLDNGEPCFTSYDYWCSGIGPNLLQPVGDGMAHEKWKGLLDEPDPWDSFYQRSVAPDILRSQFPASSCDKSHMNHWFSDSWISGRS